MLAEWVLDRNTRSPDSPRSVFPTRLVDTTKTPWKTDQQNKKRLFSLQAPYKNSKTLLKLIPIPKRAMLGR
jgi:hypothetical protein